MIHQWWPTLLRASWQAGVIVLLILVAQRLLGSRLTPRGRYGLWLLVVVRLALPWTVPSTVSLFNFVDFAPATELSAPAPRPVAAQALSTVPAIDLPVAKPPALSTNNALNLSQLLSCLPLIWAGGAAAWALCLALAHYRLWRRITPCRLMIDSRVTGLLEDCKQLMGVRVPVVLVETAAVEGPSLFGWLRPRLLLPPGFTRDFSLEELRHVFLHELSHVKRHDIPLGWLMAVLQALHWFNPLVWLAFSRLRTERELACDALALSHTGAQENKPYGRTIVKLLEKFGNTVRVPSVAGIMEDKQQMKERICMIASYQKTNRGAALAGILMVSFGLLTLTDCKTGDTLPNSAKKGAPALVAPQVVRLDPSNGAENVNAALTELRVTFDVPMSAGFSWCTASDTDEDFPKLPKGKQAYWTEDKKTCVLPVELQPGETYRLSLNGFKFKNFQSEAGLPLSPIGYSFTTGGSRDFVSNEQRYRELAGTGDKWAAYWLWDSYYRGKNGIPPDAARADQWLREFVKEVWLVRFEPVDGFSPASPEEFLARVNHYAHTGSGKTDLGTGSFFRTTKEGDKLMGSFLCSYPEELKAGLEKVPGLKIISVEKMSPQKFIQYEQSPQESL